MSVMNEAEWKYAYLCRLRTEAEQLKTTYDLGVAMRRADYMYVHSRGCEPDDTPLHEVVSSQTRKDSWMWEGVPGDIRTRIEKDCEDYVCGVEDEFSAYGTCGKPLKPTPSGPVCPVHSGGIPLLPRTKG